MGESEVKPIEARDYLDELGTKLAGGLAAVGAILGAVGAKEGEMARILRNEAQPAFLFFLLLGFGIAAGLIVGAVGHAAPSVPLRWIISGSALVVLASSAYASIRTAPARSSKAIQPLWWWMALAMIGTGLAISALLVRIAQRRPDRGEGFRPPTNWRERFLDRLGSWWRRRTAEPPYGRAAIFWAVVKAYRSRRGDKAGLATQKCVDALVDDPHDPGANFSRAVATFGIAKSDVPQLDAAQALCDEAASQLKADQGAVGSLSARLLSDVEYVNKAMAVASQQIVTDAATFGSTLPNLFIPDGVSTLWRSITVFHSQVFPLLQP